MFGFWQLLKMLFQSGTQLNVFLSTSEIVLVSFAKVLKWLNQKVVFAKQWLLSQPFHFWQRFDPILSAKPEAICHY